MQILIDTAELLGAHLKNIKANIPIIKKNVLVVLHIVSDEIKTHLEKGQRFLNATPLSQRTLNQLKNLILIGSLQLSLQLTIPLETGKQKLKLLGFAYIEKAKLKIPAYDIQLDQLTGPFSFTEDGVSAQKFEGNIMRKAY